MKQLKDEKLIYFDPNYPFLLPDDWKDRRAPTVYEILATSNTLKQMYAQKVKELESGNCLLYTSPSPRDGLLSRMPSSA